MTQTALADALGCHKSTINLIESRVRNPSPELAERIQRLTGIDARIILGISTSIPRVKMPRRAAAE